MGRKKNTCKKHSVWFSQIPFRDYSQRSIKSCAILCFLITMCCQLANAQFFPVQVSPRLIPPHSLKLSDYATTTSEKLLVNLLVTDANESFLQVRLRLSITGKGVNLRSTNFVLNATPIQLSAGEPLRLSNLDLRPYFDILNLEGITPRQYQTPLPDGLYNFCFEVFDWTTGRRLSEKRCALAYLVLNDPPFLNLPQRGELIPARDFQNIIFQWTPRHINATGVSYEFELRELWDAGVDPQTAFLSSPNLYKGTTLSPTLHYGPGETSLLEGKTYGWRVRALVSDGISETAVFKNKGYSEIYHFTYTEPCDEPKYLLAKAENTSTEEISWQQNPKHLNYKIQYRKASTSSEANEDLSGLSGKEKREKRKEIRTARRGVQNRVWFEKETTQTTQKLYFLEAGTTYEYRVGGQCLLNGGFSYTQINTFTTPRKEEANDYNCGIPPEIVITNQDPLQQLVVNDVFTAGDFPVTVQEVYSSSGRSGEGGSFSGWGFITVPYLADTQLRVEFNNIGINTDKQLITGVVETVYDTDFATEGGNDGMDDISDELEALEELAEQLVETIIEEINAIVQSIEDGSDAEAVIQMWQEVLDDPDNNLTNEQRDYIEEGISDKEKIKEGITDLRERIEKGELTDEELNQYYVSNFTNSDGLDEEETNSLEIAFSDIDFIKVNNTPDYNTDVVYVSPAGVAVTLPKEVIPAFYTVKKNPITAYGVLASFTITEGEEEGIYLGHRRGAEFTGYKRTKGDKPYQFKDLPDSNNIRVRSIDNGMGCDHLFFEGKLIPEDINDTGTGSLIMNWRVEGTIDLLTIKNQSFTNTCMPLIEYTAFTEYIFGFYNYYEKGGFLRATTDTQGNLAHVYTIADGENGQLNHYQYNKGKGLWQPIIPPSYDVNTSEALKFLFGQLLSSDSGHFVLDAAGMAPLAGEIFDAINGAWYSWEGETNQAALSFASTIPFVYASTAKHIGKVIKLADGSLSVIKFSETATKAFAETVKRLNFKAEDFRKLDLDLANDKVFAKAVAKNPKLLGAWKVIENNSILRKKPENLENIIKWLDEGIEPQKLIDGIAKSRNKQNLIDELVTAKSKLHASVLIKDYDNIPGVVKGRYVSNGSALTDKASLPTDWKIEVDLPSSEIKNFAGKIEALELKQGDKIYRVSHANGAGGAYWTRIKPDKLDDVVGGTAVQPEWNNFQYLHEYTVPDGVTIKTWAGKTARQRVSETIPSNYHLPGGDEQLFINYIGKQDSNFQSIVKSVKAEW